MGGSTVCVSRDSSPCTKTYDTHYEVMVKILDLILQLIHDHTVSVATWSNFHH